MSQSFILKINRAKKAEIISFEKEYIGQSMGSAPIVWNELSKEFYDSEDYNYNKHLDTLWPRYQDLFIEKFKRVLLIMTFDLVYVKKDNYSRAAKDIRRWLKEYHVNLGFYNNWPKIADIYESDPDCLGLCIWHNSIIESGYDGRNIKELSEVYDLLR